MKTLIVYFSNSGNTKAVAEYLNELLPDSELKAIEMRDRNISNKYLRMFWYGAKTLFNWPMPIKPMNIDWTEYDRVILGAPVWVGQTPPPLKAFISEFKDDMFTLPVSGFCTCEGDEGKYFTDLANLLGKKKIRNYLVYKTSEERDVVKVKSKVEAFVEKLRKPFWRVRGWASLLL